MKLKNKDIHTPNKLNIFLAIISSSLSISFLYLASHNNNLFIITLSCLAFAFINNTNFSLMHEASHRVFHSNKKINNLFGHILAAWFPTSFSVQTICHLGHHRRNRTDSEFFEAYTEGDSLLVKKISLYNILIGIYWTYAPLALTWMLISPKTFLNSVFNGKKYKAMAHIGGEGMLSDFYDKSPKDINRYRLEFIFSLSFQIFLFLSLNLKFSMWLACYWSFALLWGSIQYADHAYSKRDVRRGAWNLGAPEIIKKIFLNYHYHKVHHEFPQIPWIHLPKFVNPNDPFVSHWKIYKKMWKGPVKVDKHEKVVLADDELIDILYGKSKA